MSAISTPSGSVISTLSVCTAFAMTRERQSRLQWVMHLLCCNLGRAGGDCKHRYHAKALADHCCVQVKSLTAA